MKLIAPFLKIQQQLRVFHWQTESYAQHKAFGKAYENLDELIDQFIEVFTGKYGRPKAKFTYNIELKNYDENFATEIDDAIYFLIEIAKTLDATADTDLLNIRDEMLSELNRLKYLLSLR
jgi:DNA-binding ferritin-like protein